jgi:hypothetical protein
MMKIYSPRINFTLKISALIILLLSLFLLSSCQRKRDINSLPGIWHGTIYLKNRDEVPIKLELQVEGQNVIGSFLNGEERVTSTSGAGVRWLHAQIEI